MKKMLLILVITYLVFIFNCTITVKYRTTEYTLKYNGLLWVGLDYYTILKYHSSDAPMRYISLSKIK